MSTPSNTTQALIDLLIQRDAAGQRKYGISLDRADLSCVDWAQHAIEESLDRAGYLVRVAQTAAEIQAENIRLAEENVRLRAMLQPILELARTLEVQPAPSASQVFPVEPQSEPIEVQAVDVVEEEPVLNILSSVKMLSTAPTPEPVSTTTEPLSTVVPPGCIGAVEAAKRMGVARNTVVGWVSRGHLEWAGDYKTPAGNMGKYVRLSDIDAVPAKLEQVEKDRRAKSATACRAVPTEERSKTVREAIASKRDIERPEGGVSYAEAAQFLGLATDSIRLYAQRGLLERIGTLPYVTRASVVARKKKMEASAKPAFDLNESGRYEAVEEGKTFFRPDKYFALARVTDSQAYRWLVIARGAETKGGEIVEHWSLNGLGQWESTPVLPGAVGHGTGTRVGPILGTLS